MAAKFQFQPLQLQISLFLLFLFSDFITASESTSQNIQVYFPIPTPPPSLLPTIPPPETTTVAPSRSSNKPIAKAIAITASCTLVVSGLLFLLLLKFKRRSKKETTNPYASRINYINGNLGLQKNDEIGRFGEIKRVIADDEEGLDVVYWKKLPRNGGRKSDFDFPLHEIHFLREKSSRPRVWQVVDHISYSVPVVDHLKDVRNQETIKSQPLLQSPPPPPALQPPNAAVPPPAPPAIGRKSNAPLPPLRPNTGGLTLSLQRPPPPPKDNMSLSNDNQVKLKPLYWDKVNANVGQDMVWHKLQNGSFR